MKKLFLTLISVTAIATILTACGQKNNETAPAQSSSTASTESTSAVSIKVAASPVPHAEILSVIEPLLQKQGVNLEIVRMTD